MLERPSSYFIINLLVVDLLEAIAVLPLYIIRNQGIQEPFLNGIVCDSFRFSNMVTFYVSTLGVPLIALDRLIGAAFVFQHRFLIKLRFVLVVIVICWIYVLSLCVIPFFSYDHHTLTDIITKRCIYKPTDTWTISMLVVNCFLPYILILFCNKYFVKFLRKMKSIRSIRKVEINKNNNMPKIKSERKRRTSKIAKLSVIIGICYGVLNGPSVIYYMVDTLCPDACFPSSYNSSLLKAYIEFIVKYLAFLNSLAPPLIYCFSHKEFRKRLQSITRKKNAASTNYLKEQNDTNGFQLKKLIK
ncbi:5-hydroxytryptamine receptor 7-like [Hydra vulgaris]|uniref:5-hydroxytryptamine receptor 7-like n=1 Tax=Hydra vulgaris TaxID=6087 RepID=A0ABM4C988_HYDVU